MRARLLTLSGLGAALLAPPGMWCIWHTASVEQVLECGLGGCVYNGGYPPPPPPPTTDSVGLLGGGSLAIGIFATLIIGAAIVVGVAALAYARTAGAAWRAILWVATGGFVLALACTRLPVVSYTVDQIVPLGQGGSTSMEVARSFSDVWFLSPSAALALAAAAFSGGRSRAPARPSGSDASNQQMASASARKSALT
jgi:hypothetical protein